tara:strand:+ start:620 stop:826 length:207 start_codon:yes stop_codon:yes gene_type:complete
MRELTGNERAVLEHVVIDADAWWHHANVWEQTDEESALAAKVERHQTSYESSLAAGDYKNRLARDADV